MDREILAQRGFENEFVFAAVRSSGPGGQNVNKVSSKVELRFNIAATALLSEGERELAMHKLANRITAEGELIVVCQSERSQLRNKELAIVKFYDLLTNALTIPKVRKPSKPSFASKAKRLNQKRIHSLKKSVRRKSSDNDL